MQDYELSAKYAYSAAIYNAPRSYKSPSWEELDESSKELWRKTAEAAVNNFPGPISIEVGVRTGHGRTPIIRHFSSDLTRDSIAEMTRNFQTWIEELAATWR